MKDHGAGGTLEQGAADLVVGVDLGGTNTSVGIVDDSGRELLHSKFPTRPRENAAEFVARLAGVIHELLRRLAPGSTLRGIGIASPAANGLRGTIESPANLGWGTVNIMEMVRQHFAIPVAITNDANAALMGEQMFGVARGMKNVIMITLGTGLGAGIAVDGKLLQGENGSAGEFGHMTLEPQGAPYVRSASTISPRRPSRDSRGTGTRSRSKRSRSRECISGGSWQISPPHLIRRRLSCTGGSSTPATSLSGRPGGHSNRMPCRPTGGNFAYWFHL